MKYFIVILFYFIVPNGLTEPILSNTKAAAPADALAATLEDFRCRMHIGIPELGVPPVDPFTLEYLPLDLTNEVGINVHLFDLYVTGLNQFIVEPLIFQIAGYRFQLGFLVPKFTLTGKYETNGMIENMIPIVGEGDLRLEIDDIKVELDGKLDYGNSIFTMGELNILPSIGKFNLSLENFMDGGEIGDFYLEAINAVAPEILAELWPTMENEIIELVKTSANEFLVDVTLTSILTSSGSFLPPFDGEIEGGVCNEEVDP